MVSFSALGLKKGISFRFLIYGVKVTSFHHIHTNILGNIADDDFIF